MLCNMLALALLGIKPDKDLETAECTTGVRTAATENLQLTFATHGILEEVSNTIVQYISRGTGPRPP